MKLRKTLFTALTGAVLAVSLSVTAFAANIVIGEAELKEAAEMTEGKTETGNIQLAGSPTLAYVDGKGLLISGRTADWNAIDVLFANLTAGTTYVMEVDFAADTALEFKIGEADSPYSELAKSSAAATSDTLSVEFTITDEGGELKSNGQNRYRLQTTGTDDYYVAEVRITEKTAAAPQTGDTNTATTTDKAAAPTGVGDVAVITGLMVIATGGVLLSRKK